MKKARHIILDMLEKNPGMSQSDLAAAAGVSRQRASQIMKGAGKAPGKRQALGPRVEYKCWHNMIARCNDPEHQLFSHYGGRGIGVCYRWLNSFPAFFSDMGERPSPDHSIDRINNDGNYEPSNCRWATKAEQRYNQRRDMRLKVSDAEALKVWKDRSITSKLAARIIGLDLRTCYRRYKSSGRPAGKPTRLKK